MLSPPLPRCSTVNVPEKSKELDIRPVWYYVADKGAWSIEAVDMFDKCPASFTGRDDVSIASNRNNSTILFILVSWAMFFALHIDFEALLYTSVSC